MVDSRGQFAQTRMPLCNDRCSHAVHRQLLLVHRNALGIRHTRARRHGRESGSRSAVSMAFGRGNEPTNEPQVRFSDFASAAR